MHCFYQYLLSVKNQLFNYLKLNMCKVKKEGRKKEGDRQIFQTMVSPPTGYNFQGLVKLKPYPLTSSESPIWMAGTEVLELSRTASQDTPQQRMGNRSWVSGTRTKHSDMVCRQLKWWFNQKYLNIYLSLFVLHTPQSI